MTSQTAATAHTEPAGRDLDEVVALGKAVGDRLRAGILQVLRQDSYAVSELCELFDVPQPALSHHLKILHQAGLVARRREGNSIFYRRAALPHDAPAATLLNALDESPRPGDIEARITRIHDRRNERSAEFFVRHADRINARQAEICEPATYADVVLQMIDDATAGGLGAGQVLEVGPGAGLLLAGLADRFERAVGVDNARPMLSAARETLARRSGVRLRYQDFMTLPRQRRYDAVVAAMVVHHQASPAAFFRQAARLTRAGGALVVVELVRHDQEWAAEACGDQWLGFEPEELMSWAASAGYDAVQSQYLAQKNGFGIQVHRFRMTDLHDERQQRKTQ